MLPSTICNCCSFRTSRGFLCTSPLTSWERMELILVLWENMCLWGGTSEVLWPSTCRVIDDGTGPTSAVFVVRGASEWQAIRSSLRVERDGSDLEFILDLLRGGRVCVWTNESFALSYPNRRCIVHPKTNILSSFRKSVIAYSRSRSLNHFAISMQLQEMLILGKRKKKRTKKTLN